MNYPDTLRYLYSLINYEKTDFQYTDLKLDRMRELIDRLGHPEKSQPVVLVAGTKGKGSTSYYLERILSLAGRKTGLYVKPHLLTFRERIRLSGELISPDDLAHLVTELRPVIESMDRSSRYGSPTYFEVSVALAFQHFQNNGVDIAVMEVGLGGRLDATNVAQPALSVITPISYDHTEILGNTLPKIAREKAGILRSHVPLICGLQEYPAARDTIQRVAFDLGTPVIHFTEHCRYQIVNREKRGSTFTWSLSDGQTGTFFLSIPGDQQVVNFLTALLAARELGVRPDRDELQSVLSEVCWPGRIQHLQDDPTIIFDVAHNQASFATLCQTLRDYFGIRKAVFLLGFLNGKDHPGIAEEIAHFGGTIFLTTPFNPKAILPQDICPYFSTSQTLVRVVNEPFEARNRAMDYACEHHLPLVVAGSFYLAKLFAEKLHVGIEKEEVELC